MSQNSRGWLLQSLSYITALAIYAVVPPSGELKKIQECCNCVDNLQAHIVFFMRDIRHNCVVRFRMDTFVSFLGFRMNTFVSFLGMGVRIFREIWTKLTFLPTWEGSCFWKRTVISLYYGVSHMGRGGGLGTKVVISALRMLASYMRFNGTGMVSPWGKVTIKLCRVRVNHQAVHNTDCVVSNVVAARPSPHQHYVDYSLLKYSECQESGVSRGDIVVDRAISHTIPLLSHLLCNLFGKTC